MTCERELGRVGESKRVKELVALLGFTFTGIVLGCAHIWGDGASIGIL